MIKITFPLNFVKQCLAAPNTIFVTGWTEGQLIRQEINSFGNCYPYHKQIQYKEMEKRFNQRLKEFPYAS